jgi:DNA polymerase-3 subunit beta
MKLLSKVAPKHTRVPTLSDIYISNGIAYASDVDTIISTPCTYPDGLRLVKYPDLVSERSPLDYPTDIIARDIKEKIFSVPVTVDIFKTLSPAMSKEATRYYICGIAILSSGIFAATNGHMLMMHPAQGAMEHYNYKAGVIIPSDFVKFALEAAKECKVKDFVLDIHPRHVVARIGKYTIQSKLVDGSYPDIARVIPEGYARTTMHDQKQMAGIAKVIATIEKAKGKKVSHTVKFSPDSGCTMLSDESIRFESVSNFEEMGIGFNAFYLSNIPSGIVEYKDSTSPIKVISGEYTSVLMPLRV